MNYYAARQRERDGRYDFTCMNDGKVWPVGYCHRFRTWTASDFNFMPEETAHAEAAKLNEKYAPHADLFHEDGHATAAEAQACYRRYLLDTKLEFSTQPNPDEQHRCAAIISPPGAEKQLCGAWTQHAGWVAGSVDSLLWPLCPTHQTREAADRLFPSVGTIISS